MLFGGCRILSTCIIRAGGPGDNAGRGGVEPLMWLVPDALALVRSGPPGWALRMFLSSASRDVSATIPLPPKPLPFIRVSAAAGAAGDWFCDRALRKL